MNFPIHGFTAYLFFSIIFYNFQNLNIFSKIYTQVFNNFDTIIIKYFKNILKFLKFFSHLLLIYRMQLICVLSLCFAIQVNLVTDFSSYFMNFSEFLYKIIYVCICVNICTWIMKTKAFLFPSWTLFLLHSLFILL